MPDSGKVVVDTYAWVEYFKGSDEGATAKKFIEGRFEMFTPSIVIAELSDKYRREGVGEWELRNKFIKLRTKILPLDETIADKSGELKQEIRKKYKDAGLADAIVLAHSMSVKGLILTGDEHLRHLENSIDMKTKN